MPVDQGLTQSSVSSPEPSPAPSVDDLQFHRAEAAPADTAEHACAVCKQAISNTYFRAAGRLVCPTCAGLIEKGTQAPRPSSLGRAALYGAAAAVAGSVIYATVAIVTDMSIGLVAILVGIMVGKAIRHASGGLGGRPQQILAVVLTYLAITTSYFPVFLYDAAKHPRSTQSQQSGGSTPSETPGANVAPTKSGLATAVVMLIAVCAAAPFFALSHGSGYINLLIIFFGLSQAWKRTAQTQIPLTGPYQLTAG